jgi:cytochrome c oxidase assembly protein subunit 15
VIKHPYNKLLHRIAILTACATFPHIFMGGLVTSKHAGMSVPDWPNSYGYNMFLFPPRLWIGGILYEHTHRLMGTVVGMLSILLTIVAWKTESRRWVRWLATIVLGAVIFQGVLGGLRVVLVQLDLAIVHACFAQAFFCLTAFMALVTSKWWARLEGEAPAEPLESERKGRRGRSLALQQTDRAFWVACLVAVVCIYLQLIVGAVMRHYQAGLAIPDFPASYGHVLPPTTTAEVNAINLQNLDAPNFTLAQIWLAFGHRIGALLVTIALLVVIVMAIRRRAFLGSVALIGVLLITQITLGILTVLLKKPADVASTHVAVGALTLMTTFVLLVRAYVVAQTPSAVLAHETPEEFDEKALGVFA